MNVLLVVRNNRDLDPCRQSGVREMESQDSGSTLLETVRIAGLSLETPQRLRDPVAKICECLDHEGYDLWSKGSL